MVNAIKFNKNLHKEQDIHDLIGSYLSDNNSIKLYNKISSMLYNKLKNNIMSKREYTKLVNKIK